jgi:trimethylamine--corrinoid protein Co-methyltransferase
MIDELQQVGPGGHFLDTAATRKHYREFWFPKLLDRKIRPQWLEAGGTTLGQRLNEKVRRIVQEYRPQPLAEEQNRQVQEILAGVMSPSVPA